MLLGVGSTGIYKRHVYLLGPAQLGASQFSCDTVIRFTCPQVLTVVARIFVVGLRFVGVHDIVFQIFLITFSSVCVICS